MAPMLAMPAIVTVAVTVPESDAEAEARRARDVGGRMSHNHRRRACHRHVSHNDGALHDNGSRPIDDGPLDDDRCGLIDNGALDHDDRCGLIDNGALIHDNRALIDDRRALIDDRRGVPIYGRGVGGCLSVDRRSGASVVMVDGFGEHGGGDDAGQNLACCGPFLVSGGCLLSSGDRHCHCCQSQNYLFHL